MATILGIILLVYTLFYFVFKFLAMFWVFYKLYINKSVTFEEIKSPLLKTEFSLYYTMFEHVVMLTVFIWSAIYLLKM